MKRLAIIAAALLVAGSAAADTFAMIPNKAGGGIYITDFQGSTCKEGTFIAYTSQAGGEVSLFGCWFPNGNQVMVEWSDGTFYTYPVGDFVPTTGEDAE